MKQELINIVACPLCKGKLQFDKQKNILVCRFDKLAFPIVDGIPVLIESEADKITLDD
ncbi:hypothetical protein CF386_06310 [Paraphotobacterium marinum]|uniref:UPF0434 protein CF386_06310 n=1 Tax=Paraphotobacterium marinum TaxID=1755811 RepID=A0A220VEN3_9GAMM|nr:Trm112 family protein [Paraphotobacterium marinum]ASK78642.1 hypothetical protein CF386_06310 [Paraphotobacterium marinum]